MEYAPYRHLMPEAGIQLPLGLPNNIMGLTVSGSPYFFLGVPLGVLFFQEPQANRKVIVDLLQVDSVVV